MSNDPHLLALGQIEADRAAGRLTPEQYETAKADLTAKHRAATKPLRVALLVIILIPILLLGGCLALVAVGSNSDSSNSSTLRSASSQVHLTSADIDPWPLTVSEATLHCDDADGSKKVTVEAGGLTYALNGTAKGFASEHGWRDLREIWADNPNVEGLKVDVGPLTQRGLALC